MPHYFMKHFVITETDAKFPLYVESVGFNPHQRAYHRTDGYPYYHWLQTYAGEGQFIMAGQSITLKPGQGTLLLPGVPHEYAALTPVWETYFLTFGGSLVQSILASMELHHSSLYHLETPELFYELLHTLMDKSSHKPELTSSAGSADVFQFLTLLKSCSHGRKTLTLNQRYQRLAGLLQWLDENYDAPDIGLSDMAEQLSMSPQYLNTLFRNTYGTSPYSYLLQLRLQKAKALLVQHSEQTIKSISSMVGFTDASHFIATFRRLEGMTPEQFKKLYQ